MQSVKLVWATPEIDKHLAYIARVSNPENQENENIVGLLRYMLRNDHVSPFEMSHMCVEINTTRDIGRQILRHRSFSFQEFCVAGDTLVTLVDASGKTKKRAISRLYEYQNDSRVNAIWDRGVRVYNEATKSFVRSRIKEVFKTGVKHLLKVTLEDGKTLTCTKEHRFFTRTGFAALDTLSVGDLVAVNGQPVYKSAEWMTAARARNLRAGAGVAGLAAEAGISYHTVRKWLKVHGIQFTKKDNAIISGGAWNKGLPRESQPRFGKPTSAETRAKMVASSRKGVSSNLYVDGSSEVAQFRVKVWQWQAKHKYALLAKHGHKCCTCGSGANLEIDHVVPVSVDESRAFDLGNLQVLCAVCHREKSTLETIAAKQTVRWKRIVSIESAGEEMTYDLEVEHGSHNYIANGIVTHNSQRYQSVDKLPELELRECRLQDPKNRQNSLHTDDAELAEQWRCRQGVLLSKAQVTYQWALDHGIAKEQARAVLPEGLTPSRLYMVGSLRSWIHYLKSRLDPSTQQEHRLIAAEVQAILRELAPVAAEAAGL